MSTTLFGWGAMFGLPSPSPYVMKTDIQLQMLGVAFDRAIADLDSVSKHKAPYVRDGGVLVQDSTFIRRHFEARLGLDLDAGLSPRDRAAAWALEQMLEQRLAQIEACERWLVDANFDRGPRLFFAAAPESVRDAVAAEARAALTATLVGSGLARHSREERAQLAAFDIAACSDLLGDQDYFGGAGPCGADAAAFGVLAACATDYFEGPLPALIAARANLTAYLARMRERFFGVDLWPPMA